MLYVFYLLCIRILLIMYKRYKCRLYPYVAQFILSITPFLIYSNAYFKCKKIRKNRNFL